MNGSVKVKVPRGFKRGVATMEMVIVVLLVAVACVVAVVCVNRALVRDADVMQLGLTGQAGTAAKALSCPQKGYRKQVADDVKEQLKFAKDMSNLPE